jgi:hypothetical protein
MQCLPYLQTICSRKSPELSQKYIYIEEIPRLKNKTLNLSVKIEKFIKQFLQIQAIFWSETCLVTTVVIGKKQTYKEKVEFIGNKQKQDILSELQPNRQSSTSTCKESSINSSCQHNKFEFKQEGTKIQFNFNSPNHGGLQF